MPRSSIFLILSLSWMSGTAVAQERCQLLGRYGTEAVPVYKTEAGLVSFRADVDVNTDGALQSYKVDDLGHLDGHRIQTRSALNTICNGVNIRTSRHELLYSARQCTRLIREFERLRRLGWNRPHKNYVEFYAIALKPGSTLPGKNRGEPCVRDGYYVSQVARPIDSSKGVCDPDRWVGAIVGDTNPTKIGEGTVRLNMLLRQTTELPSNYQATVRLKIDAADYVVFPGTASLIPKLSNSSGNAIEAAASQLINKHGLSRNSVCSN